MWVPLISVCRRQRQADPFEFEDSLVQSGLSVFQDSQRSYTEKPCLETHPNLLLVYIQANTKF